MTTRKTNRKQKLVDWLPRLPPLSTIPYSSVDPYYRPGLGATRATDVVTLHDHIGLAKLTMKNAIRYLSGRKAGCRRRGGNKGQDQDLSVSPNVHVPMDFTGAVGKIVEDPKEVEAIGEDSPYPVLKRNLNSWRGKQSGLDWRIDFVQPWFQGAMGRDQANSVLLKYGQIDGTFIVRFSRRIEGAFVLSYVHSKKVYHTQILPFLNPHNVVSYSLDQGSTKFFDLVQLVDFYTLNQGVLVSNLTYFLEPEDLLEGEDITLLHSKHEDDDSHDSTDCQADLYFDQSEMLEFHQSEASNFNQSESSNFNHSESSHFNQSESRDFIQSERRNFNQSESVGDLGSFPHIFKQKSQYSLEEGKSRLKSLDEPALNDPTADQDSGYLEAFNQVFDEEYHDQKLT